MSTQERASALDRIGARYEQEMRVSAKGDKMVTPVGVFVTFSPSSNLMSR